MTTPPNILSVSKMLSGNDVGKTGTHQAGILIPKRQEILDFFPPLDKNQKNPRIELQFTDDEERIWKFSYIYYNNRFFGGTRNEFRLTWMTKYIKSNNLKIGDEIFLTCQIDGTRKISFKRNQISQAGKLTLSTEWKAIKF